MCFERHTLDIWWHTIWGYKVDPGETCMVREAPGGILWRGAGGGTVLILPRVLCDVMASRYPKSWVQWAVDNPSVWTVWWQREFALTTCGHSICCSYKIIYVVSCSKKWFIFDWVIRKLTRAVILDYSVCACWSLSPKWCITQTSHLCCSNFCFWCD